MGSDFWLWLQAGLQREHVPLLSFPKITTLQAFGVQKLLSDCLLGSGRALLSPSPRRTLQQASSGAATQLQRQGADGHTADGASTSLLQSQWPSPELFPAWELLPWTGQIELLPPCKTASSSSCCLLSSVGTWIPSLTKVRYGLIISCTQRCRTFPAKFSTRLNLYQWFLGLHELGNSSELSNRG